MTELQAVLAGPAGAYLTILAMTGATYLCRAGGVLMMSRVTITPRVERALRALPGSIVVATILPLGLQAGPAAAAGLVAAVAVMALVRHELAALAAGLGTVAAARALGL